MASPEQVRGGSITAATDVYTSSSGPQFNGMVTIKDGETTIGNESFISGFESQFETSTLAIGTHSVTAVFDGDGSHRASTSTPVSHTVILGTPVSLSATASGTSSVELSWTAVAGATGYEISRNNAFLQSTTPAAYDDTAVSANTSYVLQRARDRLRRDVLVQRPRCDDDDQLHRCVARWCDGEDDALRPVPQQSAGAHPLTHGNGT